MVTNYNQYFTQALDKIKDNGQYRYFTEIKKIQGRFPVCKYTGENPSISDEIIVWCSNDYMGMGTNIEVIKNMKQTLDDVGCGSGGTRNISGNTTYHAMLENKCANWHGKEKSVLFTSGYVANLTAIGTLGKIIPNLIIYSDELNHNSIIEGIKRSECKKRVFRHNDINHLEELIAKDNPDAPKLIIFESLYSMDGDFSDIHGIIEIAEKYNCLTYIDEVHSIGVYGHNGSGYATKEGVADRINIIQGTLGKSIGQIGGYIASNFEICDAIRSFGNGYIFTTSLPPSTLVGAMSSIDLISKSDNLREEMFKNIEYFFKKANGRIDAQNKNSHIIPIIIGNSKNCKLITDELIEKHGHYAQPINFPTVPIGTERIRISITPYHTFEMIDDLINNLEILIKKYK